MKHQTYSLVKNADGSRMIVMNTPHNIGLMAAISKETGATPLLAAAGKAGLPHLVIQTGKTNPISYFINGHVVNVPAESFVAAYNTPQTADIKGAFHIAVINEKDVEIIKNRAEKRGIHFGQVATRKKAATKSTHRRNRADLFSLPTCRVTPHAFSGLLTTGKARLIYKSPSAQTPLVSMIEILPNEGNNVFIRVQDLNDATKNHAFKVYPGQVLALAKRPHEEFHHLCSIAPEDRTTIIAQDRLACHKLKIGSRTMDAVRRLKESVYGK